MAVSRLPLVLVLALSVPATSSTPNQTPVGVPVPPMYPDSFMTESTNIIMAEDVVGQLRVSVDATASLALATWANERGFDSTLTRNDLKKLFMVTTRGTNHTQCYIFNTEGEQPLPKINLAGAPYMGTSNVLGKLANHFRVTVGDNFHIGTSLRVLYGSLAQHPIM